MSVTRIRERLERHGLHLRRDRGQNFLIDDAQAQRLARLAGVEAGDSVIEIGTGLGVLTHALAARAERVLTIEVDSGLVRALREEGSLPANVELLHADALELDLAARVRAGSGPFRVVANLPYSAATPLLRRLLDLRFDLVDWSVTLQREVAGRVLAPVGSRDYGSLAALHQLCVDARRELDLHPRCFYPAPNVHSSFVRMTPRADTPLGRDELLDFERIARAAFHHRRKTIVNSLHGSLAGVFERATLIDALSAAGIEPRIRAEQVEPLRLLALSRELSRERARRSGDGEEEACSRQS